MSHQNADDKSTTKPETSLKTDRELAIALRAMALATQDPSPVFELKVDCWEEIFDWLSVVDLDSFGRTCKFFHRIAGKYFEWKYRKALVGVKHNRMGVCGKDLPGLSAFAQRLSFFVPTPDTSLLYASANYMSPKELKIMYVPSTDLDIIRLKKMLASVEVLSFKYSCWMTDEFMESILKLCATNLERLTIVKSTGCDWMLIKYPKLQHLEFSTCNSAQEFVQFFETNPNVRSFSTSVQNILDYRKEFMASTIELDDLTVRGDTMEDVILNALIDLYRRGFYKRLHLTTCSEKHLADLPGLTTLNVRTNNNIELPHLPTVTRMSLQPVQYSSCSFMRMDKLSDLLPNVECVLMHYAASMEYLMPFIRNSKRLKEIKIRYFRDDHNGDMDPVFMNSERVKLDGAHKVTIYISEENYLRIKWKYNKSDFDLIQFKRHESYDGMLHHSFD